MESVVTLRTPNGPVFQTIRVRSLDYSKDTPHFVRSALLDHEYVIMEVTAGRMAGAVKVYKR